MARTGAGNKINYQSRSEPYMSEEELLKKYRINETHDVWTPFDDNNLVEIYRLMNDGELPKEDDTSAKFVTDFLDKKKSNFDWWLGIMTSNPNWGSLLLTAKRAVYLLKSQLSN